MQKTSQRGAKCGSSGGGCGVSVLCNVTVISYILVLAVREELGVLNINLEAFGLMCHVVLL